MFRISLFGAPYIEQAGQPISLTRSKGLALLTYLAVTRQPQQRDGLLALLWPEFDAASARNNLRRELSMLRATLGEGVIEADRAQVSWSPSAGTVDVAAFHQQLARAAQHDHAPGRLCPQCAEALAAAARLYRGDLLAGFGLADSPAFEEWLFFQREGLRQQLAGALAQLTDWNSATGGHEAAVASARRWLALDPLHEPAQRALLRAYAQAGQHAAALRQYEECARLLDAELGAIPEAETSALYEAIKARRFPPTPAASAPVDVAARPGGAARDCQKAYGLPRASGFVGRQRELADIIRRLTDPSCRLLTLTGPGGIGKTRLAAHVAQTLADTWAGDDEIADGVVFVQLASVSTASGLVSALAAAARFDFYPNVPPQQQVISYFSDKRMLVVLDNFEQLVDEASFVAELIAEAPGLRLLVTSREALSLHEEWFHPLDGLSFPIADDAISGVAQLARFDAVRLFEQHARRIRADFSLARERAQVVRLCRLVEGMPLALELAASWLKVLSVDEVVAALEHGLDILTWKGRDTPARHRSMRAVLEESWGLLTAEEQAQLARLAVCRGSFSAAAASAVASAALTALTTLVEKSLLRVVADGRFQLHELLRQFVCEKLSAEEAAAARRRHSRYYLALLAAPAGQAALSVDIENIEAAWRWASDRREVDVLATALEPFFDLNKRFGRYHECLAALLHTSESLFGAGATAAPERLRAQLLARQGVLSSLLGDAAEARRRLAESLALAQALGLQGDQVFTMIALGRLAIGSGDYAGAMQHLTASLDMGRALDDKRHVAGALENLAEVMNSTGERRAAKQLALESLAISRAIGDSSLIAHALDRLGFITFCLGEYAEAKAYYQEGLAIFKVIGHLYDHSMSLGGLGIVLWAEGAAEARACYEQSIALFRKIGNRMRIVERLINLSNLASDEGAYDEAEQHAREGLVNARSLGTPLYESICLSCLARVASERGDFQRGKAHMVAALRIAVAAQISLAVIHELFSAAALLAREARAAPRHAPAHARCSQQALELLEIVMRHPATWQVYVERARRLSDDLRRDLSPEAAEAAVARGRRLDWRAGAAAVLDAWSALA
jgi:predicted ATPase/DNA-binding SARP family transcriptional activator